MTRPDYGDTDYGITVTRPSLPFCLDTPVNAPHPKDRELENPKSVLSDFQDPCYDASFGQKRPPGGRPSEAGHGRRKGFGAGAPAYRARAGLAAGAHFRAAARGLGL